MRITGLNILGMDTTDLISTQPTEDVEVHSQLAIAPEPVWASVIY